MFVSICAYCGKVYQIGRGVKAGGQTYCCWAHANPNRILDMAGMPGAQITHRHGRGPGFLLDENGDPFLCEGIALDGYKFIVEGI